MTAHFRNGLALSLIACLFPAASTAEVAADVPRLLMGLSIGSVDTSADYRMSDAASAVEAALDVSSDTGYSLAAGIENDRLRITLELYHSETAVASSPLVADSGASELETRSIFYSGYWLPDIYWGIQGVLGAGIGYSRHYLTGNVVDELKDGGWSLKASAGVEYGFNSRLSLYGLAEMMFHKDLEEQWSSGETAYEFELSGHEQVRLAVGLNYRF